MSRVILRRGISGVNDTASYIDTDVYSTSNKLPTTVAASKDCGNYSSLHVSSTAGEEGHATAGEEGHATAGEEGHDSSYTHLAPTTNTRTTSVSRDKSPAYDVTLNSAKQEPKYISILNNDSCENYEMLSTVVPRKEPNVNRPLPPVLECRDDQQYDYITVGLASTSITLYIHI